MSHSTSAIRNPLWPALRAGYDRKSLGLLVVVTLVGLGSGIVWRDYLSLTWADFDPLLVVCWILMVVLGAFRFSLRRDLPLAGAAFVGGALIETWGTRSGLWTYFTHEAPPLFILPAWPVAALATERLTRGLDWWAHRMRWTAPARLWRVVYVLAMCVFCMDLWAWTAAGRAHPTTAVAYALVAVTCCSSATHRRDVLLFVAGSLLGALLEYWGTTRQCWTYSDQKTPPVCAVLSHGFATVAFARAVHVAHAIRYKMTSPRLAA
jgi:hypothetical protein